MTLNPNVKVNTSNTGFDKFTPADGYELWRDNEEGNLDENGEPISYMQTMYVPKSVSEDFATHIWAHLIGESVMTETEEKAAAYDVMVGVEE